MLAHNATARAHVADLPPNCDAALWISKGLPPPESPLDDTLCVAAAASAEWVLFVVICVTLLLVSVSKVVPAALPALPASVPAEDTGGDTVDAACVDEVSLVVAGDDGVCDLEICD
jgi:hypothetical protein